MLAALTLGDRAATSPLDPRAAARAAPGSTDGSVAVEALSQGNRAPDFFESAPGLLTAGDRILAAWPGNPEVDTYADALADAWRIGPFEAAPRARHLALYAPCILVAPDKLPASPGHSVEWEGPFDAQWKVTRGLGEHDDNCALDVTQKPEAVKSVELAGHRYD